MGNDRSSSADSAATAMASRDRELLIPVSNTDIDTESKPSNAAAAGSAHRHPHHHHHSGGEAFSKVVRSWASKKFMTGWTWLRNLHHIHLLGWGLRVIMAWGICPQSRRVVYQALAIFTVQRYHLIKTHKPSRKWPL